MAEGLGHKCLQSRKHTFDHRLRTAGVGFRGRKTPLGHKSEQAPTHYPVPKSGTLIAAADRVCDPASRKSHARP